MSSLFILTLISIFYSRNFHYNSIQIEHQQTRQLESKTNSCTRLQNCFDCQSANHHNGCTWDTRGKSCDFEKSYEAPSQFNHWYERYEMCDDYLNLCRDTSKNSTHFKFSIDQEPNRLGSKPQHIPTNYFCHFQMKVHPHVVDWELQVYRWQSKAEIIEIISKSKTGHECLLTNSDIHGKQVLQDEKHVEKFSHDLEQDIETIDIYIKQLKGNPRKTFEIKVVEQDAFDWLLWYLKHFLGALVCFAGCFICFFVTIRLVSIQDENRIRTQTQVEDWQSNAASRDDQESKVKMTEFIKAIQDQKFTKHEENNKFDDCIICLDQFQEGVKIKLIPICQHLFHIECCTKWFETKYRALQQRCPQCAVIITTESMLSATEKNSLKINQIDFYPRMETLQKEPQIPRQIQSELEMNSNVNQIRPVRDEPVGVEGNFDSISILIAEEQRSPNRSIKHQHPCRCSIDQFCLGDNEEVPDIEMVRTDRTININQEQIIQTGQRQPSELQSQQPNDENC